MMLFYGLKKEIPRTNKTSLENKINDALVVMKKWAQNNNIEINTKKKHVSIIFIKINRPNLI